MMVVSYIWGQKYYRIPYAWKKLVAFLVIVLVLFFIHRGITMLWGNVVFSLATATILIGLYTWFIVQIEKREFKQLPVVGRYIR